MTKRYSPLAGGLFESTELADDQGVKFSHLRTYDSEECPGGPADLTGMFLTLFVFTKVNTAVSQ